jgi:hypothetical protein
VKFALVLLSSLFWFTPLSAAEFKRLETFKSVRVAVPSEWPCSPAEEGALVCREPKGLATLSIQLLRSRHETPLGEVEARSAAARGAKLLAAGEGERFGSPYEGWETPDGGALRAAARGSATATRCASSTGRCSSRAQRR